MAYDVVVIGSGPGGYSAAIRAGQYGLKTAIIEKDPKLGGTCLHVGCIPTKALLHSADVWDYFLHPADEGISVDNPRLDYPFVVKRKQGIVDKHAKGVEMLMKKNKIDVIKGFATLQGGGKIKVSSPEGELAAATAIYQQIIDDASADRTLVAQAQLRLGLCELKQGNKPRALSALGRTAEATPIFTALASEITFYGMLSAEAIGQRQEILSAPLEPDAHALAAFGATPGIRRALKLAQLDMRPESQREWLYVVRGLDDDALLLAADYARRNGLYDRAINTAERTTARHDYGLRYMMPYRTEFDAAARAQNIDTEILYGIARQESRFVPDIVSSAGAVGVMQLMPGTARWVAKQLARPDYRQAHIAQVDVNTEFGAFYFKYWQDRLDGQPALAAAAYNAGPGRAQQWRPATAPLEGAIWVETIPFNETRDYVKKVLANTMIYTHTLQRPYASLSSRLGIVAPRSASATALAVQAE